MSDGRLVSPGVGAAMHMSGPAVLVKPLSDTELYEIARRFMGASKVVPLRATWWDADVEWIEPGPVRVASVAEFEGLYSPHGFIPPVGSPTFRIDRYGSIFSATWEPRAVWWRRVLRWPRNRWNAWRFDRGTGC